MQVLRLVAHRPLVCPKCGTDDIGVPEEQDGYGGAYYGDELDDDFIAVCSKCGHRGPIRDLARGDGSVTCEEIVGHMDEPPEED